MYSKMADSLIQIRKYIKQEDDSDVLLEFLSFFDTEYSWIRIPVSSIS